MATFNPKRVTFGTRQSIGSAFSGSGLGYARTRRISEFEAEKSHKEVMEWMESRRRLLKEMYPEDDDHIGDQEQDPEDFPRPRARSRAIDDEDDFGADALEAAFPRPRSRSCTRLEDYSDHFDLGDGDLDLMRGRRVRAATEFGLELEGWISLAPLEGEQEEHLSRGRDRSRTNDFSALDDVAEDPSFPDAKTDAPERFDDFQPRPRVQPRLS